MALPASQVNANILIIEDDPDIRTMLEYNLAKEGYTVRAVDSATEAFRLIRSDPPDLVLLDVMLPGSDGFDICKRIKSSEATRATRVIMVSARSDETDVVVGLEIGADDYVTKPFSLRVLLARIRRQLRQGDSPTGTPTDASMYQVGELEVFPDQHRVLYRSKSLKLTAGEFKLLCLLAQRPGRVYSRDQIIDYLHDHTMVSERAVDVQVVGLRRNLGPAGAMIETVRGIGYRIEPQSSLSPTAA